MQIWGLTGNIACGKSAVEDFLRRAGVPVIDADQVAREVVQPGEPALQEITELFGPGILDEQGSLNRPALGTIIFAAPAARKQLEAIPHPRLHARAPALPKANPRRPGPRERGEPAGPTMSM